MRKERILTNAPIGQWVSKTNLMSDYIGDLDNLDSTFQEYDADSAKHHDSNIVAAIKPGIATGTKTFNNICI